MKGWSTLEKSLVSLFVFVVLALYFPILNLKEEVRIIITTSTFLFGIFAGFVIASRLTRYAKYRELLTNETGSLIALYKYAKTIDEKYAKKIADAIEKYLIKSFEHEVYEYHEKTEDEFYHIFNQIREYQVTKEQEQIKNTMFSMIRDMLKDREELFLLGKDKITLGLKTVLYTLSGVIVFSLFLTRSSEIYSNGLIILTSSSVLIVLSLINDLDKLNMYRRAMSYEIYYRVFDAMKRDKPKMRKGIIHP